MNALLLALAIFSGTVSASPSAHLTYDSPTVGSVAAPVAVAPATIKPVAPAKIAKPVAKPKAPAIKPKAVTQPAKITKPKAPAKCAAPTLMAEDGSCVNPHFWDEPAPVVKDNIVTPAQLPVCDDEDDELLSGGKTVTSCYWDAKIHGTGKGTSFVKYGTDTGTAFRYLK